MSYDWINELATALIEAASTEGHHATLRSSSDDTIEFWKARTAILKHDLLTEIRNAAEADQLFGYAYGWKCPSGIRWSLESHYWNGRPPDQTVPLYTRPDGTKLDGGVE